MAILGQSFSEYVEKQINTRQKSLGGTVMTVETLKAYNTQTPWIRLASSVDIKDGDPSFPGKSVKKVLEESNILEDINYSDDNLAKNFVLFGGVNTNEGGIDNMPHGVNRTKTIDKKQVAAPLKNAYGFGYNNLGRSSNRGYVPMPGVESVDFSYKNDGALAQASVKVKCFSREQFQMIDILFQRPGYTVLLEFGHTVFKDNAGELQYAGEGDYGYNTLPFTSLYNPKKDQGFYHLLNVIQTEKEKWGGNYEGFFAKISKYNWKFNQDGSYDITINLIGLGDVISSLKMNTTPPSITQISESYVNTADIGAHVINATTVIKSAISKNITQTTTKSIFEAARIAAKKDPKTKIFTVGNDVYRHIPHQNGNTYYGPTPESFTITNKQKAQTFLLEEKISRSKNPTIQNSLSSAFALELARILTKSKSTEKNHTDDYFEDYESSPYPLVEGTDTLIQEVTIPKGVLNVFTDNKEFSPSVYICFGTLLSIIQQYSNLYSEGIPLIQFDFRFDKMQDDDNYIRKYAGLFSSSPDKILIPFSQLPSNIVDNTKPLTNRSINTSPKNGKNFNSPKILPSSPFFTNSTNVGRLAYVYLHTSYLSSKYKDATSKNGEVLTLDFLKNVLSDINSNLNGLNNFKIIHNKETNRFQILSETPLNDTPTHLTTINTFGVTKNQGSFVRGIDLDSELSDNFATLTSVGAQSGGTTSNVNSTSFSTYNKGLIDRIIPEKSSKGDIKTDTESTGSTIETWSDIWTEDTSKIFKSVYVDYNVEASTLSSLKDLNGSISTFISSYLTNHSLAPSPFFLPFNLKLTMDGLSGMKIYDSFQIDGKVLPPTYSSSQIQLIIKSLSHSVSKDGWVTKIETFSKPLFTASKEKIKAGEVPNGDGGGGGVTSTKTNSKWITTPFTGPTPNADILRKTLKSLGYVEKPNGTVYPGGPTEKGLQLSNRGDIVKIAADGYSTFFKKLKELYPETSIRVTGGNDLYHQTQRSAHSSGNAIDFVIDNYTKDRYLEVKQLLQQFSVGSGGKLRYFDEYVNSTSITKGAHFHTSIGFIESQGTYSKSQTTVLENQLPVYKL